MKKLLSVLLAAALLAALAACGGGSGKTDDAAADATSETTATADTAADTAQDRGGSAAGEVENRVYTVACSADFPPYEYFDNEQIVGAEVEIMNAIAEKIGIEVTYEDMDFDSIIPSIESGKYDIGMSGFTITDDRKLIVNFTDSYTTSCQAIIVPDGSPIASVDDLHNHVGEYKIGVQLATTGDIYASDTPENGGFGPDNVEEYTKSTDAILALTSGKIDCVIIDEAVAKAFAKATEGLSVLPTAYVVEDYAMVLNKKSTELLDAMNGAIQELLDDGTIDTIMAKYISE